MNRRYILTVDVEIFGNITYSNNNRNLIDSRVDKYDIEATDSIEALLKMMKKYSFGDKAKLTDFNHDATHDVLEYKSLLTTNMWVPTVPQMKQFELGLLPMNEVVLHIDIEEIIPVKLLDLFYNKYNVAYTTVVNDNNPLTPDDTVGVEYSIRKTDDNRELLKLIKSNPMFAYIFEGDVSVKFTDNAIIVSMNTNTNVIIEIETIEGETINPNKFFSHE